MQYAIIAAGQGSRLAQEGIQTPKPLVKIHNECLIDRLIRIFQAHDAERITVICNTQHPEVVQHLSRLKEKAPTSSPVPLEVVCKDTPSSMHSFHELAGRLSDAPFVLTTVDTVFDEQDFSAYIRRFAQDLSAGYEGTMGVTDYIDDEKPLYVGTDSDSLITGFFDTNDNSCTYISAGIYGLTYGALDTLHRCVAHQESRMRNFQRALIRDGKRLRAFAFSKVLDIDHRQDIEKAEQLLSCK